MLIEAEKNKDDLKNICQVLILLLRYNHFEMTHNPHIELDLNKIKKSGKINERKNLQFRTFLKQQDSDKIDIIVHRLNREITEKIDCTQCANCCKILRTCIQDEDIKPITQRLNISEEQFREQYTEVAEGELLLREMPCVFLENNKCTIYIDRPMECRTFPNLHKEYFTSRLFGIIENYSLCPIVFNVYEK